jgi:ABC-2 type transport system permease protein
VAGSLAWITVSAEDAPDLLASAPAPSGLVRGGKLAAAALPLAALLAPFLLPLLVIAPVAGLAATAGCAASVAATSLVNVWWQRPGKRTEFRRRRRASWFVTVVELLISIFIAAATALAAAGLPWAFGAPVPAMLAGLILLALRRSDAQIAEAIRAAS